jgi:hypothetical protein
MSENTEKDEMEELLQGLKGLVAGMGVEMISCLNSNRQAQKILHRQFLKAQLELARGYVQALECMIQEPDKKAGKKEKIDIR